MPGAQSDEVRDRLASLLADVHSTQPVRAAVLETLVKLNDPRLTAALVGAVRDAGLEGSPLLQTVEERLSTRKDRLK